MTLTLLLMIEILLIRVVMLFVKEEVRRQRREKEIRNLKASKAYKFINTVTTLADKYFLDALLGLVPSVGDLVSSIFGLPFIYVYFV